MSLDTLFEKILLNEQQLTEQTQKLKDVKVAIIKCKGKIKSASEKYEKTREICEEKAQHLYTLRWQLDLAKKGEEQMLKQIEELLRQKSHLGERLAGIKRTAKENEENFIQEISRFNHDFSLCGNSETMFETQTNMELQDLEREVESLYKEMELMSRSNSLLSCLEEEKRALLTELHGLKKGQKDLDGELSEAEAMTEALRSESQLVSQKPFTDSTCLRLKKELELLKEEELEHLRELQILQSVLIGSMALLVES
ncbi:coiled-coil domain-containing protein 172-like [Pholidichthys leucotaenia]